MFPAPQLWYAYQFGNLDRWGAEGDSGSALEYILGLISSMVDGD